MGDRKRYRATVCFGASSTTDDLEGELTPGEAPAPDRAASRRRSRHDRHDSPAAARLQRDQARWPPRLRDRARRRTVELAEREVTIHRLDLLSWDGSEPDRPVAILDVECSAGTYVRALARDLGAGLGSGAISAR
jgi:tRNA pseudouridine55 synthase